MVNVSNGLIHYNGVSPGSVATLNCSDGYTADSLLNRTCMFGGRWSNGALECDMMDEKPSKLELSFSLHSFDIDINFFPNAFYT